MMPSRLDPNPTDVARIAAKECSCKSFMTKGGVGFRECASCAEKRRAEAERVRFEWENPTRAHLGEKQ